mgnify:CR=1 FL=1
MNDGKYVPLSILKRDSAPAPIRQVIKPETSRLMLDLMVEDQVAYEALFQATTSS